MGEPVNRVSITDIDPRQMQKNARIMLRSITLTFIACMNLFMGSIIFYHAIIEELFRNNLEAFKWAVTNSTILISVNLFVMMIQVMMVISHYAPTLGLKKDSPFDFEENVVVGKEYDEATISGEKRAYNIFAAIGILIMVVSIGSDFHNIHSGFFNRLSLSQIYGGICLFFFYLIHSYLAFTGKYYVVDWKWGTKTKDDAR